MSSNTLRGIGQEGDGDADTPAVPAQGRESPGTSAEQSNRLVARVKDLQEVRPAAGRAETRPANASPAPPANLPSLDGAVPDAAPSLDGKVPALAGTLLGVAAPLVAAGVRDKGTVQGRDVHLPIEAQRMAAGMRAVGAIPSLRQSPGDHPVAVVVDRVDAAGGSQRVRTPLLSDAMDDEVGPGSNRRTSRRGPVPTHELPTATADVDADDSKPNLIGRVAIGVAVAAVLSVVILGIIRMNAQGSSSYTSESRYRTKESYKSTPTPAVSTGHTEFPTGANPSGSPGPAAGASESGSPRLPPKTSLDNDVGGTPTDLGDTRTGGTTTAKVTASTATRPGVASAPKTAPRSATTPVPPARPSPPVSAPQPTSANAPAIEPPPVLGNPAALPPRPSADPGAAWPTPVRPAPTTDRPRPKGVDDPDSTLPLNFD